MRLLALALVLGGGLSGCSGQTCDPTVEDCGTQTAGAAYDGAVGIKLVTVGCCNEGDGPACNAGSRWWYDVVLEGRAASATIEIAEIISSGRSTWRETHSIPQYSADEQGYWEDRYLEIPVADTADCPSLRECSSRYLDGVRTLFVCPDDDRADTAAPEALDLTWALRVVDSVDTALETCLAWGASPQLVSRCTPWEGP